MRKKDKSSNLSSAFWLKAFPLKKTEVKCVLRGKKDNFVALQLRGNRSPQLPATRLHY